MFPSQSPWLSPSCSCCCPAPLAAPHLQDTRRETGKVFQLGMPRHVDKRRQRCQQRHRRIYANQLGCLLPWNPGCLSPCLSFGISATRVGRPFRGKLGNGKLIWLPGWWDYADSSSPTSEPERVGSVRQPIPVPAPPSQKIIKDPNMWAAITTICNAGLI